MSKTSEGNFFEDFEVGKIICHAGERTITEGDVALYTALTGERRALFASKHIPRALGLPDALMVPDLLGFHMIFGLSVPDISRNSPANLGYADVCFLAPIFVGDTIRAETLVIGKRETSREDVGIVWVHTAGFRGLKVLGFKRWMMVNKRNKGNTGLDPVVPNLPPVADLGGSSPLALSRFSLEKFQPAWTDGQYFWEDYEPGETIYHPEGFTIFEGTHQAAVNLYGNNAAVHLNQELAEFTYPKERKCIVYGGHVISVCHRVSFYGLENALWILGINAGTHVRPVFAGDTLYAVTEVLERIDLGRQAVGALRLRLIGVKIRPIGSEARRFRWEEDGKVQYNDLTVLDLDYTVLMLKRNYNVPA